MADIRIKDLTTTASSTASDDFIAVDGTTNGTRKLNAFSPTFGGNAAVTGTLSSGGNLSVTGTSAQVILGQASSSQLTYLIRGAQAGGAIQIVQDALTVNRWLALGGCDNNGVFGEGLRVGPNIQIPGTTASTSTSSGALVVGNGTSGGLGVGGAITLGSNLTSTASDGKIVISGSGNTTGTKELQFVRADGGDSTVLGLAGSAYAGVLTGLGNNDAYLYTSSAYAFRIFVGTSSRYDFTSSQFKINPTTISNSTSSGALVVSGGVGVAGNINGGGAILAQGALGSIPAVNYLSTELSSGQGYITCYNGSGSAYLALNYRASQHNFTSNGAVAVQSTTASTSTSSGALVVGGGVGVAGAIYAGGNITIDKAAPDFTLTRSANTNSGLIQLTTSTTYDFAIGLRNTTDSDLHIYNYGTSNDALKIARSDSLATFGGAVRTAAPSGGTAANWKLGTVASVSPTSPNRTIEVDIGGTIYYIHAKTTNN